MKMNRKYAKYYPLLILVLMASTITLLYLYSNTSVEGRPIVSDLKKNQDDSEQERGPLARTLKPKVQQEVLQERQQLYDERMERERQLRMDERTAKTTQVYAYDGLVDPRSPMYKRVTELPPPPVAVCTERVKDMIYIKLHKCASDTTTNILQRFGLRNNLSFMLPVRGRMTLSFPYHIENHSFRPFLPDAPIGSPYHPKTNDRKYNIICEHATYQPGIMRKHTKPSAPLFTSIREPFARLKSAFNFFGLHRRSHLFRGVSDAFRQYLSNITVYERAQTSPENYEFRESCLPIPYSFTNNGMSFGLGLESGFYQNTANHFNDEEEIAKWLNRIEKEFSLVMLVEHFNESLVLLRRLMCWSLLDILYVRRNTRDYKEKQETFPAENIKDFKRSNKAEYALYDRFNQTLWLRIKQEVEFDEELEYFNGVTAKIAEYCAEISLLVIVEKDKTEHFAPDTPRPRDLVLPMHKWNPVQFSIEPEYCSKMSKRIYDDLTDIYELLPDGKKGAAKFVPGC